MAGIDRFTTLKAIRKVMDTLTHLQAKPRTRAELETLVGCSKSKMITILRHLRSEDGKEKEIYIFRWKRTTVGGGLAVYAIGNLPDAVDKPKQRTASQRYKHRTRNESAKAKHLAMLRKSASEARRIKYPTIHDDALGMIRRALQCSTSQVASQLGVSCHTAYCILGELQTDKLVRRVSPVGAKPVRWGIYAEDWQSDHPDACQRVVLNWQAQQVPKQSIFAALGI